MEPAPHAVVAGQRFEPARPIPAGVNFDHLAHLDFIRRLLLPGGRGHRRRFPRESDIEGEILHLKIQDFFEKLAHRPRVLRECEALVSQVLPYRPATGFGPHEGNLRRLRHPLDRLLPRNLSLHVLQSNHVPKGFVRFEKAGEFNHFLGMNIDAVPPGVCISGDILRRPAEQFPPQGQHLDDIVMRQFRSRTAGDALIHFGGDDQVPLFVVPLGQFHRQALQARLPPVGLRQFVETRFGLLAIRFDAAFKQRLEPHHLDILDQFGLPRIRPRQRLGQIGQRLCDIGVGDVNRLCRIVRGRRRLTQAGHNAETAEIQRLAAHELPLFRLQIRPGKNGGVQQTIAGIDACGVVRRLDELLRFLMKDRVLVHPGDVDQRPRRFGRSRPFRHHALPLLHDILVGDGEGDVQSLGQQRLDRLAGILGERGCRILGGQGVVPVGRLGEQGVPFDRIFLLLRKRQVDRAEIKQGFGLVFAGHARILKIPGGGLRLAPFGSRVGHAHLGLRVSLGALFHFLEVIEHLLKRRLLRPLGAKSQQQVHVRSHITRRDAVDEPVVQQIALGPPVVIPLIGDLRQHQAGLPYRLGVEPHAFQPLGRLGLALGPDADHPQLHGRVVVRLFQIHGHRPLLPGELDLSLPEVVDDAQISVDGLLFIAVGQIIIGKHLVGGHADRRAILAAPHRNLIPHRIDVRLRARAPLGPKLHFEYEQPSTADIIGKLSDERIGQFQGLRRVRQSVGEGRQAILDDDLVLPVGQVLECLQEPGAGLTVLALQVVTLPQHQ